MSRVTGRFESRFGPTSFSMTGPDTVMLSSNLWLSHRVEYTGRLDVKRCTINPLQWQSGVSDSYIRRVDQKDINYKTDIVSKLVEGLTRDWQTFINKEENVAIKAMAFAVYLDNQHKTLMSQFKQAQDELVRATDRLKEWNVRNQQILEQQKAYIKVHPIPKSVTIQEN